LKHL
jgi:hypothetical protein